MCSVDMETIMVSDDKVAPTAYARMTAIELVDKEPAVLAGVY